jgi:hypothetical protein
MTIYKYRLKLTENGIFQTTMPKDAKILSCQLQNDEPTIWAIVKDENDTCQRRFAFIGTGWPLGEKFDAVYISTLQMPPFVWHVFDLGETP